MLVPELGTVELDGDLVHVCSTFSMLPLGIYTRIPVLGGSPCA